MALPHFIQLSLMLTCLVFTTVQALQTTKPTKPTKARSSLKCEWSDRCRIDPCMFQSCPNHPNATCDPTCGSCRPTYRVRGVKVICSNIRCPKLLCSRFCRSGYRKDKSGCRTCHCNRCTSYCPLFHRPVCGSDGKTYTSKCRLNISNCRQGSNITAVHVGKCKRKCRKLSCTVACRHGFRKDKSGCRTCHCNRCSSYCPQVYRPVCGSDGKFYTSKCRLNISNCRQGSNITAVHFGKCKRKCRKLSCTVACRHGFVKQRNCDTCQCKKQPKLSPICTQAKVTGPCKARFTRFWYNHVSKVCANFVYGGCGGNQNNFRSERLCRAQCPTKIQCPAIRCQLICLFGRVKDSRGCEKCKCKTGWH